MNKPAATATKTTCQWGICTREARALVTVSHPEMTGFDGTTIPAMHEEHRVCSSHRVGIKSESRLAGLNFTWRKI